MGCIRTFDSLSSLLLSSWREERRLMVRCRISVTNWLAFDTLYWALTSESNYTAVRTHLPPLCEGSWQFVGV